MILPDFNLPGTCAVVAMRILHTAPITSHIPIIVLNACALRSDIRQSQRASRFHIPIEMTQLTDALDAAMWHSPSTSGPPAI
jgi:CheY-like chemotaxis protein